MKEKTKTSPKEKAINTRPPIVTIMGHVDHGKTTLLDTIRNSNVAKGESGGITQHIGAYTVSTKSGKVTFIDTPGHEAFTQMRARGGKAADIIILVVASDDGVMPQTKEAIMHAKAANVPIVVAITKCDLPAKNIARVKQQLSSEGIFVEGYGGDTVVVEVSAIKNTGMDQLLEVISLIAEMHPTELACDESTPLEGIVIESRHDAKRGVIVSVIVKNGALEAREDVLAGGVEGRVKLMSDAQGKMVTRAIPGDAVEILGFTTPPDVGSVLRKKGYVEEAEVSTATPDGTTETTEVSGKKVLHIIVRADTVGTQEAVVASIQKIKNEDAVPQVLFSSTGEVKESDVLLASTSKAIIFAFKVRVPKSVLELAQNRKVLIREHDIIYKLLEEIEGALEGVLEIEEAKIKGRGLVIEKFTLPKSGMVIAGTLIENGKFKIHDRIGIFRGTDDVPVAVSRIRSLHIGKNEVERAQKGDEVGILLKPAIENIQLDDRIEAL